METLKLIPIEVPWKVSSSEDISKFNFEDDRLELLLVADLLDLNKLDAMHNAFNFFDYVSIVQLQLTFETIVHFSYSRPQQHTFGLDPQKYDFQAIYPSTSDIFFEKWARTKKCPDPQMYQIENSDIKQLLNIKSSAMSHWVLVGHDEIIHVIAEKFRWEVVKYLEEIA